MMASVERGELMRLYIKEARELIGLSQKELAEKVGIAPNTFNGYETGKHDPKSDILIRIANVCGVTTDFLLGIETKSNAPALSAEALRVARQYELSSETIKRAVLAVLYSELSNNIF